MWYGYIIIAIVVVALLAAGFLFWRHRQSKKINWAKIPEGAIKESLRNRQTTAKGITIYSEDGVTHEHLVLADEAADEVFALAKAADYDKALDYSFYDIYIPHVPCAISPEQGIRSFLIRADVYDGTQYDQHYKKAYNPPIVVTEGGVTKKLFNEPDGIGVVHTTELIRSIGIPGSTVERGQMYVCSEIVNFKTAVGNAIQHIVIANNDQEWFELTWFHDIFGHPLLPKPSKKSITSNVRRPFDPTSNIILKLVR